MNELSNSLPNPGPALRRLRQLRKLSLEQASELTGVSRPMLSQIERGTSSPTITTLWKIAAGLKVPLSSFIIQDLPVLEKARPAESLKEEAGRMQAWLLFPFDPVRAIEIWKVRLDPGCRHESVPHASQTEEYVLVSSGSLDMAAGNEQAHLEAGDGLRFPADVAHAYVSEAGCCFFNVILYGKEG